MPAMRLKTITWVDQPERPHQDCGARQIRPRPGAAQEQARRRADRRERQQPGDLAAELGVEHAQQAGCASELVRRAARLREVGDSAGRRDAARELAEDAAEAVVAEEQLECRAVGRAADVRPHVGRRQLNGEHPPAAEHDDRQRWRRPSATSRLPTLARCGDQIDDRERRQDQVRLQELGVEGEADEDGREDDPAQPAVLERRAGTPRPPARAAASAARPGCCSGTSAPRPA